MCVHLEEAYVHTYCKPKVAIHRRNNDIVDAYSCEDCKDAEHRGIDQMSTEEFIIFLQAIDQTIENMENQSINSLSSNSISAQGSPIIHSFSFEHPITEDHFLSALSDSVCSKYTGPHDCYEDDATTNLSRCQPIHVKIIIWTCIVLIFIFTTFLFFV